MEKAVDEGEVVEQPEVTEGDITHIVDNSRYTAHPWLGIQSFSHVQVRVPQQRTRSFT